MDSPTTHQLQTERQASATASTSTTARQRLAAGESEAEAEQDPEASSATTTLSALLSGDRLVVSVAEAGQLLGVSRAFAYELAARGELPTIRLGRRVVVPKVALLAMVGISHSHL
jgi:excisionase family DNA binding protein